MSKWRYSSTILDLGTRTPDTDERRGWLGSGAGLDAMEYRNKYYSCRESNPAASRRYTNRAIQITYKLNIQYLMMAEKLRHAVNC
jgi:hypothetical protein